MQQLVEMSASVKLSAQMHVSLNEAKAGKSNNSTEQPDNSFFPEKELGGIRTHCTLFSTWALYQLSYIPDKGNLKPLCYGTVSM